MLSERLEQVKAEITGLEKAINQALLEYGDEAYKAVHDTIAEMKKEVPKKLKAETLSKGLKTKGGGTHYANGWRAKLTDVRTGISLVVYNANKPTLTHLLENGHAKVDGGTVNGTPHIEPVNEWAQTETLKRIEEKL